jgi:hypothetical protein
MTLLLDAEVVNELFLNNYIISIFMPAGDVTWTHYM